MKKTLLFAIIALSFNAFSQSKHPTSHAMGTVRGRMENPGIKTSDIGSKMNPGRIFKHEAPDQGSLIRLFDSTYEWQWDTLSSGWKIAAKGIDYIYDSKNNLTSDIWQNWNGNVWVNSNKYLNTYDGSNNCTIALSQTWNGSAWVNSDQYTSSFDANNNQTAWLAQNWNGSAWVNSDQYTYSYDANNILTIELYQTWNGSGWVNQNQDTYSYDSNNNRTGDLYQSWNGSGWVNSGQWSFTYDANNNLISELFQSWNSSGWVNSILTTYSYDSKNNLTSDLFQTWNGSAWANYMKDLNTYDSNNNLINDLRQIFNGTTWVNYDQFLFSYDASKIENNYSAKYWDNTGTAVTSGDSISYYYHTVMGINDLSSNVSTVKIYPNPATDKITIELSEAIKECNLAIIDVEGQQLIIYVVTRQQMQVDISSLPQGLYFIRLTSNKTVITGKFIKL